MYEIFETILTIVILTTMLFFTYMSFHMVEEKRERKTIPLPWEKKSSKEVRCIWKGDTEA